jgi:hypothetical protein
MKDLRRWLYPLLLAVLLLPPMVQTSAQGEKQSQGALRGFQVNSQRLQQTLDKLSEFGRNPEGGVTRLGFSEADMAAREYVMGLMRQAGLAVRVDPAGNIFGRRPWHRKPVGVAFRLPHRFRAAWGQFRRRCGQLGRAGSNACPQ